MRELKKIGKWSKDMRISAHLLDTRTGERKIDTSEYDCLDSYGRIICFWTDGNYGCDCNRSRMFYPDDESKELDCNIHGNIIVLEKIVNEDTGEIIWEKE